MSYLRGFRNSPLDAGGSGSPVGIRIQRKNSSPGNNEPFGPPPTVPDDSSVTSSEDEKEREIRITREFKTEEPEIRVATLKKEARPAQPQPKPQEQPQPPHTPLGERTSYVEEPPSTSTTLDRKEQKMEKESALVRRITNDMQMAHYVQKTNMYPQTVHGAGGFSPGVYRIRSLRFVESSLRKVLWYLGKAAANHKFLFTLLPILLFSISLIGPLLNRDNLFVTVPFSHLFGRSDVISNGYGIQRNQPAFNYSNPAFTSLNSMDENSFAVLIKTDSSRDSILRSDAVLAYTALKRKLDDFPVGRKEFLETCPSDCETEREMVDRIIKKSAQVPLTYPETFVSMSRDASNLTRVYLGGAIGGVDTDTDGAISRAQAFLMTFRLRDDLTEEQRKAWIHNLEDQVAHTSASNVSLSVWSPSSFHSSLIEGLSSSTNWLLPCAFLLAIFCFVASFRGNAYQSKPLVGFQITVVLVLSCMGGLFVQSAGATSLDPLLWPVCFIVVAVGLLWCFHLHLCWSRFSFAALHPTEKIAFVLAHDGPGIAVAAAVVATTFIVLGIVAPIPHMEATFMALAAAIVVLFFFAFMYLVVVIYMGGRRECKGVKWYQLFKTGDTHFTAPNLASYDTTSLLNLHDRLIDTRPSISRTLGAHLVAPRLRYPIVFFCTAYLMLAVWGCANVKIDLREEHLLPTQSSSNIFLQKYREMFGKTTEYLEVIVDQPVDYSEDSVSGPIVEIMENAVSEGYAARVVSWLTDFQKFEKSSIYDVNPDTFVPVVNLVFLVTDPYKRYTADITFDRFQTQIIRSRMYLELTPKGVEDRVELVQKLLSRARSHHIPLAVKAPFTISLQHDMQAISSVLFVLGVMMVCLFLLTLICFGQPALTFLLLFTSATVVMETIGYAVLWGVPLNVITFTMILAGNALTSVIVMSFCYSYSVSGKGQMRGASRIQYTFQATLLPVLFACLVPVVTYLPLFGVDSPIIGHIWKVLVVNSLACLLHYLLFLPNLMLLLSEHFPVSCANFSCSECCCDVEDDNSIYYIPTTGRSVHPTESIYQHVSYTYSIPNSVPNGPPNYLAIGGPGPAPAQQPYIVDYGATEREEERRPRRQRERRNSDSTACPSEAPTPRENRRHRRKVSKDDSIYEAPPSPRHSSSRSTSPRRVHATRESREPRGPYFDQQPMGHMGQWRPFVQPQPMVFYPGVYSQRR